MPKQCHQCGVEERRPRPNMCVFEEHCGVLLQEEWYSSDCIQKSNAVLVCFLNKQESVPLHLVCGRIRFWTNPAMVIALGIKTHHRMMIPIGHEGNTTFHIIELSSSRRNRHIEVGMREELESR